MVGDAVGSDGGDPGPDDPWLSCGEVFPPGRAVFPDALPDRRLLATDPASVRGRWADAAMVAAFRADNHGAWLRSRWIWEAARASAGTAERVADRPRPGKIPGGVVGLVGADGVGAASSSPARSWSGSRRSERRCGRAGSRRARPGSSSRRWPISTTRRPGGWWSGCWAAPRAGPISSCATGRGRREGGRPRLGGGPQGRGDRAAAGDLPAGAVGLDGPVRSGPAPGTGAGRLRPDRGPRRRGR